MRTLVWIFRVVIFLLLLIFALNNQQIASIHWFMGAHWDAPMIVIVLLAFALGCLFGILAMLPRWWRQRQRARATLKSAATPAPASLPSAPAPLTRPPREVL